MAVKKESEFQRNVKNRLRQQFEGCIVLKNDPTQQQGIPDLLVLYRDKWAALEVKKSSKAAHRPNQDLHGGLSKQFFSVCRQVATRYDLRHL